MDSGHEQESLETLRLWPLQARWRRSNRVEGRLFTSVALRVGSGQSLESRLDCSSPQTF